MKRGKQFFQKLIVISAIIALSFWVMSARFDYQTSQTWQFWGGGFLLLSWFAYCLVKSYEREETAHKEHQEQKFKSLLRENFDRAFWQKFNSRREYYQDFWNLALQEVFLEEAKRAYKETFQDLGPVIDYDRAIFNLYCEIFEELYELYRSKYNQDGMVKEV